MTCSFPAFVDNILDEKFAWESVALEEPSKLNFQKECVETVHVGWWWWRPVEKSQVKNVPIYLRKFAVQQVPTCVFLKPYPRLINYSLIKTLYLVIGSQTFSEHGAWYRCYTFVFKSANLIRGTNLGITAVGTIVRILISIRCEDESRLFLLHDTQSRQ